MGEDRFGIEGMTLFVDGKAVGTFSEDITLFDTIALTADDEETEDGLWGGFLSIKDPEDIVINGTLVNCNEKLLDMLWYGRCKRWRSRRKAIKTLCLADTRKEREYDKRLGIDYGQH